MTMNGVSIEYTYIKKFMSIKIAERLTKDLIISAQVNKSVLYFLYFLYKFKFERNIYFFVYIPKSQISQPSVISSSAPIHCNSCLHY